MNKPLTQAPGQSPVSQGMTLDDVNRVVMAHVGNANASAARAIYIAQKMSDLPETYQNVMPHTEDANALAKAEAEIRDQFMADMRKGTPYAAAMAHKADLSGVRAAQAEGRQIEQMPPSPADLGKMNADELMLYALDKLGGSGGVVSTQDALPQQQQQRASAASGPSISRPWGDNLNNYSSVELIALGLR